MSEQSDHKRVSWTTRVSVRPATRAFIQEMSKDEMVPVAYLVGIALDQFITARSTS